MEERYCEYDKEDQLFSKLHQTIFDNREYFSKGKKSIHSNFFDTFVRILNVLEPLKESLEHLQEVCAEFDLARDVKGNGFRSLICITEKCMAKILEISSYIGKNRDRFFFRSYHFYMEIESYGQVILRLFTIIQLSLSVSTILDSGSLFPDEDKYSEELDGLLDDFETISRECFYGRSFGFQFTPALQQSLQVIAVAMTAYGDGFKHHNGSTARALSSFLHSGKYVVDPELRAKRMVELTNHVDMPFCKAFWSLTENHGIQHVPMLICPNLAINREMVIEVEPLKIPVAGRVETIDPCFAAPKPKRIAVRLLSYSHREGQGKAGSTDSLAEALGRRTRGMSKNLVLHCHGGGFVAQSSKSHEIYLRHWAKDLDCPILSIDYSLSPDAPYPEALNECFYVYAWALLNARKLGTTAERICFTGDSAGANLMVAVTMKAIETGIRIPNGLSIAYPPMRIQFTASPSRLLCLMDPLLPPGILKVCLRAYAGDVHETTLRKDSIGSCKSLSSFEHSYNPFDVDLGDRAVNLTRLNHFTTNKRTGKRFYSDSNLLKSGGSSARFQRLNSLKRQDSLIGEGYKLSSNNLTENAMEDNPEDCDSMGGLSMHEIEPALASNLIQQDGNGENVGENNYCDSIPSNVSAADIHCALGERTIDAAGVGNCNRNSELKLTTRQELNCITDANRQLITDHTNHAGKQIKGVSMRNASRDVGQIDGCDEKHDAQLRRRKPSKKQSQRHRRSLSDSLAEHFQRLRSHSEEFPEVMQEGQESPASSSNHSSDGQAMDHQGRVTHDHQGRVAHDHLGKVTHDHQGRVNHDHQGRVTHDHQGRVTHDHQGRVTHDHQGRVTHDHQGRVTHDHQGRVTHDHQGRVTHDHQGTHQHQEVSMSPKTGTKEERLKATHGDGSHTPTTTTTSMKHAEFSAVFHKQTDNCVIFDNHSAADSNEMLLTSFVELDMPIETGLVKDVDGDSATSLSSRDSISSSINRRARDPFMSPLLASDDLLMKLPLVLTVACTLDPLLDDAIEFTRRLKNLGKDAELFLIDDLPHGFLNLNFASSEAKDASDLIVACIKRILRIGMHHQNSFPMSPEAVALTEVHET
eukprot:gene11155-12327_t